MIALFQKRGIPLGAMRAETGLLEEVFRRHQVMEHGVNEWMKEGQSLLGERMTECGTMKKTNLHVLKRTVRFLEALKEETSVQGNVIQKV